MIDTKSFDSYRYGRNVHRTLDDYVVLNGVQILSLGEKTIAGAMKFLGAGNQLLAKKAAADLSGKGLQLVIALGMSIALTRALGAEQYGIYSFVVATVSLVAIVPRFGSDSNLMRALSGAVANSSAALAHGVVRFFGIFLSVSSLGTVLTLAGLFYFWHDSFRIEYRQPLFLGLLLLPSYVFLVVWQNGLRSFQKVLGAQIPEMSYRAVILLGAILSIAFALPFTANEAIVLTAFSAAAASILCFVMLVKLLPSTNSPHIYKRREWALLSAPLLISGGASTLLSQTDVFMLGLLADSSETGVYAVASRVAGIAQVVLLGVTAIGSQQAAHFFVVGNMEELQSLATTIARWVTASFVPTALLLSVTAPYFLPLFGAEFEEAYIPLLILIVGQFAVAASGAALILLTMTNGQVLAATTLASGAAVNVLLNYFLIPTHGMVGAAIATATTTVFIQVVLVVVLRTRGGINPTIFRRPQGLRSNTNQ
ncbi:MAG: oligosaccharide flippase family protein [Parvibaculum sp.]